MGIEAKKVKISLTEETQPLTIREQALASLAETYRV